MDQNFLSQLQLCRKQLPRIPFLKMWYEPNTVRRLNLSTNVVTPTIHVIAWSSLVFLCILPMSQHEYLMPQHRACWILAWRLQIFFLSVQAISSCFILHFSLRTNQDLHYFSSLQRNDFNSSSSSFPSLFSLVLSFFLQSPYWAELAKKTSFDFFFLFIFEQENNALQLKLIYYN